jgi:Cytochrome c554 and c-prime
MSKMNKTILAFAVLCFAIAARAELPDKDGSKHMGVASCATSQCHGSAVPRDGSNVLQNEYVTWTQDDPHSEAFATLSNKASRAIAVRLGIGAPSSASICLDCHADNVPASLRGAKYQLSDGVGCEACHGGAENWLSSHYNTPTVDHAANIAAGLQATENTGVRGELCLSCHLGTQNKFATHQIMAAGHPRLSFELDTFTELWRTAGRQPHYRVDADYRERKGATNHSYTWASGVIAEGRQRMSLILGPEFAGDAMFPELGLYDCHACHRSMKSVQWRSLPRHGDAGPGMPFLNDGALVMALALARSIDADNADDLELALVELHVAGSDNVAAIQAAARKMDGHLSRLGSRLSPTAMQNRERQVLRELLATGAEGNYLDYVSAEQAFMAVQMLVFEIGDADLEAALGPLGDALQDDERYSPARFAQLLAKFGTL